MKKVVIVGAYRSPVGSFGGVFKTVSAIELGVQVLKAAMEKTGVKATDVDEVILGNVVGAGLGQNVARQIALGAGLPETCPAFTVNKVCGSGMKTVALAASEIRAGEADCIIAGGAENMSMIPYAAPSERWGARMGDSKLVDLMMTDGLSDAFHKYAMGFTAENLAEKYNISREDQDTLATASQNKAEKAMTSGRFNDEIIPISVPQRKGDTIMVTEDEFPRKGVTVESLGKLPPAFKRDGGTVTAGNSSGINDSAAIIIVMSEDKAKALGLKPIATLVASGTGGVAPEVMGYGPVPAIKQVLGKANWKLDDVDLIELNEAFAAQACSVIKGLETEGVGKCNMDIVNVNGGAISIGHPIGASGARIIVTLLHEMQKRDAKKGLASLCIGGGMGIVTLYERD